MRRITRCFFCSSSYYVTSMIGEWWTYSIVTITVYLTFFLSCFASYFIYYYVNEPLLPSFQNSQIYIAFQNPAYIYFALTVNVAIYLPTLLDLLLDWWNNRDITFQGDGDISEEHDSLLERVFMALINITFGLVLLILRGDKNVAYYFTWFHALQVIGNWGAVLVLCRKLVPKHFTGGNILGAQLSLAVAILLILFQSSEYWTLALTVVSIGMHIYFLIIRIFCPWFMDLRSRQVLFGKESLSIKESCALWYFLSTIFAIVIPLITTVALKRFNHYSYDIYDICTVLLSFSLFGIIVNTVPGRLARNAVDREKKKALHTKQILVRYMGHEVRSPLNVLISGLTILQADISKLQSAEERAALLDTVVSMQQQSEDLLKTMNELLQLEKMESSAFFIEEKMAPCSDLLKMAEKYDIAARERGITFSVRSLLVVDEQPATVPREEEGSGEPRDIECGSSDDDMKVPDPAAEVALSVCIDELKVGQVVRNLITNAIKFTPAEKAITVTLRRATPADLNEDRLVTESPSSQKKRKVRVKSAEQNGYCLDGHVVFEVADTGVGIALENKSKMFCEFQQFDPYVLQGGGGSGLGMWISQEIIKLHGSQIRFHSDGEGCGSRFFFLLPCYKKVNEIPKDDPITPQPPSASSHPTSMLWLRSAKVSPEPKSFSSKTGDGYGCVDDMFKFSSIPRRALKSPGQCKVLVVDDSKVNNKVLIKLLKQIPIDNTTAISEGEQIPVCFLNDRSNNFRIIDVSPLPSPRVMVVVYSYSEADDGSTAVSKVQEASNEGSPFDIVFMDNTMIHMHGPEAAQLMRSAGFEGLIVGVTGNVMAHDVAHYIASGADCVLHKPVNVEELKQILHRLF